MNAVDADAEVCILIPFEIHILVKNNFNSKFCIYLFFWCIKEKFSLLMRPGQDQNLKVIKLMLLQQSFDLSGSDIQFNISSG